MFVPKKIYTEMQRTVKHSGLNISRVIIYHDGNYYEKTFRVKNYEPKGRRSPSHGHEVRI